MMGEYSEFYYVVSEQGRALEDFRFESYGAAYEALCDLMDRCPGNYELRERAWRWDVVLCRTMCKQDTGETDIRCV